MTLASAGTGSAGPLGFLVVVLLGVATVLLIRNMNARLRRLPPSFDKPEDLSPPDDPSAESASGPTSDA